MAIYYPQWLAGQDITSDNLNEMIPKVAFKASNTARLSTTTPAADPDLQFTLAANATYIMDGFVKYSSPTAAAFQVDWSAPSGATGDWTACGVGTPVKSATGTTVVSAPATSNASGYMVRMETTDVTSARSFGSIVETIPTVLQINGTIKTTNGGTYSFDWAQLSSTATNTTVYANSWLRLQRVA